MGDEAAFVVDPADPEAWRAQIFRSIDSDSAEGLPSGSQASALGLDSGKGKVSCLCCPKLLKLKDTSADFAEGFQTTPVCQELLVTAAVFEKEDS